ncbi:MAG: hypothetical protein ABJN62_09745 [Halioglobus sp.]
MHINDARQARLELSGYSNEHDYLKQAVGWEEGDAAQLNDLWALFFELQGQAGTVSDMAYAYLGSLGHEGTITDRWFAFWNTEAPLP